MILAVSAVVIFIYGMLASLLGTLLPSLGDHLRLGPLQLSYLPLAQGLGLAGTSVFAGLLMDRVGKKAGILLGLSATIVGLLLLASATVLGAALAAMLLLGIGGSLVIVGANTLVNDASDLNRASALNILNLFVGLGGMATPFLAANLLGTDPGTIAHAGIAATALAVAATLILPRTARSARAATAEGPILGTPILYVLSLITFLYTACEFAVWNWLPKLLIADGVAPATALTLLSLGFAGGMLLGRLGAARLLAQMAPVPVILICVLVMGVASSFISLATGTVPLAVLVFALGLAMAPIFPTTIAIVGRIFADRSGAAIGFAITCGFSGLVVSSPLIGVLAGASPLGLAGALLLLPACSLAIAVILLVYRGRLKAG